MMQIDPVYVVTFGDQEFRVSETNLDDFLHVLVFNRTEDFRVRLEDSGWNVRASDKTPKAVVGVEVAY